MDSLQLAAMLEAIRERDHGIDSVTVVRKGAIVADATVYPFKPDSRHVIHSCTKSIVSALIGIAIDQGHLDGLEQPVLDIFSGRTAAHLDADKEAMTLEHVLMMASGLECRDSYLYRWRGLRQMRQSEDWVQFVLDLPMAEPPGTRFEYCNGASFLLSAIIQEATGVNAAEFAQRHLFGPLGIQDVVWPANPRGISVGWGELHMRPHDMAKIGYLYLNEGQWDGQQVVPAEWVSASTRKQISTTLQDGYGYQWWVTDDGAYMALGYAGQYIVVVPEQDLVVVFTSDLAEEDFYVPQGLLDEFIIPAVASDGRLPANPEGVARLQAAGDALVQPTMTVLPTGTIVPTKAPVPPAETPTPTRPPAPTPTLIPPTETPRPATDTVCAAGCDFKTIQAAIDDPTTGAGDIIEAGTRCTPRPASSSARAQRSQSGVWARQRRLCRPTRRWRSRPSECSSSRKARWQPWRG
jgi:CubicO group peptidase (beta-lactamase class C family)